MRENLEQMYRMAFSLWEQALMNGERERQRALWAVVNDILDVIDVLDEKSLWRR